MEIIQDTTQFHIEEKTAVAFGKFDGIHVGHRYLLEQVLESARKYGYKSLVFTFSPSPLAFFSKEKVYELSTREEKRRLFEEMGFDYLVEFPLNKETAAISPEDFLREYLVKRMNAACIFAGDDVSFGKNGAGNHMLLRRMSALYPYEVEIVEKRMLYGDAVSSTRVRTLIDEGDVLKASELLGKPYSVWGGPFSPMRFGMENGRKCLPFLPDKDKLLPASGLYKGCATLPDGTVYETKIRVSQNEHSLTVFFGEFDEKLYGKDILLSFLCKIDRIL